MAKVAQAVKISLRYVSLCPFSVNTYIVPNHFSFGHIYQTLKDAYQHPYKLSFLFSFLLPYTLIDLLYKIILMRRWYLE